MSRRSKPRKSGEYVGGRPWPIVCPQCRYCEGKPPKFFYRARGLCNICYKQLNSTTALAEYEPLPEVCSDLSFQSLTKNPRRWLQKEMGRGHASAFQEGKQVLDEAMRIFQMAVSRWYGRETPPVIAYEKVSIEDVIWGNNHPDPGPMSIEDAINLKNASKSKTAARRRNLALCFWKQHGSPAHMAMRAIYSGLRKPKITCTGNSVTATWGVHGLYVSVTSMSDDNSDVFVVIEKESQLLLEEDFKLSGLARILKAAADFQKVNKKG